MAPAPVAGAARLDRDAAPDRGRTQTPAGASLTHLVQFSTGAASAEVAWRLVDQHGPDNVVLLTADTRREDEDNWRFGQEVADRLGCEWVVLADGRTPMEVGRDRRCVPSNRMAVCSQILKRELLDNYRAEHFDPSSTVVYLGYDWTEPHRVEAARKHWAPWTVDCPLTRAPYLWKQQILDLFRERGIEPPRLYGYGFQHANCLHPDTQFLTDEGIRTLRECLGKRVRVLGRGGGWRDAEVQSFGSQDLTEIRLQRYDDEHIILTTPDHLWPVRKAAGRTDYVFRPTSALAVGQRIAGMYGQVRHNVVPSAIGVAAGFTFGDGDAAVYSSGQNPPARAHLCGAKDQALLPYFASCRTTAEPGKITVHDLPRAWKMAPDLTESQSYLYGWLAGYFAADGAVTRGMARLTSARRSNLEFVRDVCARLGIATNAIRQEIRAGFGAEPTPLYGIALVVSTLRSDFFIIPQHRTRFDARADRTPRPADWQVVSVRPTGRREEVMCAVVPDGHVFTLDGNILTHNCGGACVRGGQAQWSLLLQVNRSRYLDWEAEEQVSRELLGKDVSILRDRTGGTTTSLSLRSFRERIERQPSMFDADDWGACGCFMDGSPATGTGGA